MVVLKMNAPLSKMSSSKQAIEKLYESDNFLVVNKPYDMYINSDNENEKNTLTYHIASLDSHLATSANPLHFVQRLDYSTSGVLCIAKNKNAAASAGKLFEKRQTKKYYMAVVRGHVDFEMGDIEYDVGVDPVTAQSSHRMWCVRGAGEQTRCSRPRRAHTRVLALETGTYGGDPVTVVLLCAVTGRRHQLRVHCAAVGHTILGDYTYSNGRDIAPHRMFLHARRLVLPVSQEPLDVQTGEPYFSDAQFAAKWRGVARLHNYRADDDFRRSCHIIDKSYVIGVKYKLFKYSDA